MADVNWRKYDCDICLAVSLIGAAAASAFAVFLLGSMGLGITLQVILFLVIWALLGWIADGFCAARSSTDRSVPMGAEAADTSSTMNEANADAEQSQAKVSSDDEDRDGDGVVEGKDEGSRPKAMDEPRDGSADDLKKIKGIGPKLEQLCNSLGFFHFDQIAAWNTDEVAWVDSNLEGFKGRVTRDDWVAQATQLSAGDETEFSKRVDEGDVPSSQ